MTTSGNSSPTDTAKWECEVCTYENFPSSKYCVMCRTPKDAALGERERIILDTNIQEIDKWTCTKCTYSNYNRSLRCVMCNCDKPENLVDLAAEGSTSSSSSYEVPSTTKISFEELLQKWKCKHCTHVNWPKSRHCVLCRHDRSDHSEANSKCSGFAPSCATRTQAINQHLSTSRFKSSLQNFYINELWIHACLEIVQNSNVGPVKAYLEAGGDPNRTLNDDEAEFLGIPYIPGLNLASLAFEYNCTVRLKRILEQQTDKKVVNTCDLVHHKLKTIQRYFNSCLRVQKGENRFFVLSQCLTFFLPSSSEEYPNALMTEMKAHLIDSSVQCVLEDGIINWALEDKEECRLYALWNRKSGDCLLDSVLQTCIGICDNENILRHAMGESLEQCPRELYERWREHELRLAVEDHYVIDEHQLTMEWSKALMFANRKGAPLEQVHIFILSHILRRPIVVYGVKYIKSFSGDYDLGFVRFQGVYLPLCWDPDYCYKSPIVLGYTPGHFSALVSKERRSQTINACSRKDSDSPKESNSCLLPLVDIRGKPLPIHFLSADEIEQEQKMLELWLDCVITDAGYLAARQRIGRRHASIVDMIFDWYAFTQKTDS